MHVIILIFFPLIAVDGSLFHHLSQSSHLVTAKREEGKSDTLTSSLKAPAGLPPLATILRKKKETEVLEEEACGLLSHFNHQNMDALLKVTRNALEAIRRRIHSSNTTNFRGNNSAQSASWQARHGCYLCVYVCIPVILKNFKNPPFIESLLVSLYFMNFDYPNSSMK